MYPRLIARLVVGSSLFGGIALADPHLTNFVIHDDMHAGAGWQNDRPRNNDQRGAGGEHQSISVLSGGRILVVATASYTDITPAIAGAGLSSAQAGVLPPKDGDPGVQAQGNRVEGLCAAYQLDANQGLTKVNVAYFTNNNSPDWQNAHKMHLQAVDGGKAALALYGYDPNGNRTQVHGTVLGPNCEQLSADTKLFASNDDDYGGLGDTNDALYSDSGGVSQVVFPFIGNGNGTDDGRAGSVTVRNTGGTGKAAYTLSPDWLISIEPQEERTRPQSAKTPIPGKMLFCVAAGNTRPTNDIKCGLVNTLPGVADADRLEWRQTVAQRSGNLRYSSPSLVSIPDATGAPSGKYLVSYVQVDITNRNGRTKGRTAIQTVPLQLSDKGFTLLDKPQVGLFGISDGSHPSMVPSVYGPDRRPVAFMFAGSITDGGTANTKIIGMTADGKVEGVRAINFADSSAGGYMSQHDGHNPNTPQGKSYAATAITVDNPGYGQAGGFQPDVKTFLVVAHAHQLDHSAGCAVAPDPNKGTNNGRCGGKNALSLVMVPTVADETTGNTGDPNDPTPVDPTKGGNGGTGSNGDGGSNPGTTLGGCSTTGGGTGAGTLLLLGLAAVVIRRRRNR
jgi:uncharacterized protein (TIGR03382 family)